MRLAALMLAALAGASTITTPNGGTATILDNRIQYTPAPGFVGVDTLVYTVSDGQGGTASTTLTITVTEPPTMPVANAGADRVIRLPWWGWWRAKVILDGSGSTGAPVAYQWGGNPDPDDVVSPTVYLRRGIYTFTLIVSDENGVKSESDSVRIEVR